MGIYARRHQVLLSCTMLAGLAATPSLAQTTTDATSKSSATPADAPATQGSSGSGGTGDIVVTATRQATAISRVPISIAAYDQAKLDAQNVRRVDDIARLTPGLLFTRSPSINGNNTAISIRGITSSIGSATTGIYIDDTPIQSRTLGNTATNAYPLVFDLERVEVLRGPQGTLFGASSEGGAVRFITPKPSLTGTSSYGRAELSSTNGGGMNYEVGVAVGAPIVEDKIGFRISGWYRRDAGWVDRVPQLTRGITSYPTEDKNTNSQNAKAFKGAVTFVPFEDLKITPSIYYQDQLAHDSATFYGNVRTTATGVTPQSFLPLSNPDSLTYNTPNQIPARSHDRFKQPALLAELSLGSVSLISNTSYFDRTLNTQGDYTLLEAEIYGQRQPYTLLPGEQMLSIFRNRQRVFSQEVRLQSGNSGPLSWVVGAFYSRSRQSQFQTIVGPFLNQLIGIRTGGVGSVATQYGSAALPGDVIFNTDIESTDQQIAGFAQVDLKITNKLKITAGGRISKTKFDTDVLREGPLAGGRVTANGQQKQKPFTPKFLISYQADPTTLLYASASKGFRPGGAQARLSPLACATDFTRLGISQTPSTFDSDSLWSYEGGGKTRLFGNALQLDASGYYVKWKNIQQSVLLTSCSGTYIANTGTVTSRGFDLSAQLRVIRGLTLGASVGYTKATFDNTVYTVPGSILKTAGSHINVPPFQLTLSGQYDFEALDRKSYLRFDYQHVSTGPAFTATDFGYDPLVSRLARINNLTLRVGTKISFVDLSVFADNVTNDQPITYTRSSVSSGLFYANAPRPRVIGVTVAYRLR